MSEKTEKPAATAPATSKVKLSQIEAAVADIRKRFGEGALMRMQESRGARVPAVSTGSLSLDRILGCGGYPRGRIVEIYGPESSGKTTLTLHAIAEVQKGGGVAAFIDAEHALDPKYATALGVNLSDLLISQPDSGEQALEIVDTLAQSGAVDLIVVDSVAALVPLKELEGDMGDQNPGLHARLMSQAMRKLTSVAHKHNVTVIFINQIRMKIGVMFGSPETTTGGQALKFYASLRLDVRRVGALKDGESNVGNRTRVKVVKNKLAPPFREVEFDILFGQGIDRYGDALDAAVEAKAVDKSGAWLRFRGAPLGNGRAAAITALAADPKLFADLVAAVYAADLGAS